MMLRGQSQCSAEGVTDFSKEGLSDGFLRHRDSEKN
jgi:hypothetical protein